MPMRQFLITYFVTAVVFVVIDSIWLFLMADRLYRPAIGHLMADTFAIAPALAFYLIYLVGIVVFAVRPALAAGRASMALRLGGLLGFVSYATYDLTNQATLKDWPFLVTAADLIWGTFVTGLSAAVSTSLIRRFSGRREALS